MNVVSGYCKLCICSLCLFKIQEEGDFKFSLRKTVSLLCCLPPIEAGNLQEAWCLHSLALHGFIVLSAEVGLN